MNLSRNLRALILAGTAALALGACATTSGPTVRVDADPTANMASYGTYSFFEPFGTDRSGAATPLGNTVKQALRREMDVRGLRYVESGGDLMVNAGVKSSDKTDVSTMSVPDPYFGYRYGRYSPWVGYNQETIVRQYTEGTLTIDLVDRARKQLVWSGAAFGRVTDKVRSNPQGAVDTAVREIFARYPKAAAQ
jgi:Domain of unknown function (DUF4136)